MAASPPTKAVLAAGTAWGGPCPHSVPLSRPVGKGMTSFSTNVVQFSWKCERSQKGPEPLGSLQAAPWTSAGGAAIPRVAFPGTGGQWSDQGLQWAQYGGRHPGLGNSWWGRAQGEHQEVTELVKTVWLPSCFQAS